VRGGWRGRECIGLSGRREAVVSNSIPLVCQERLRKRLGGGSSRRGWEKSSRRTGRTGSSSRREVTTG